MHPPSAADFIIPIQFAVCGEIMTNSGKYFEIQGDWGRAGISRRNVSKKRFIPMPYKEMGGANAWAAGVSVRRTSNAVGHRPPGLRDAHARLQMPLSSSRLSCFRRS